MWHGRYGLFIHSFVIHRAFLTHGDIHRVRFPSTWDARSGSAPGVTEIPTTGASDLSEAATAYVDLPLCYRRRCLPSLFAELKICPKAPGENVGERGSGEAEKWSSSCFRSFTSCICSWCGVICMWCARRLREHYSLASILACIIVRDTIGAIPHLSPRTTTAMHTRDRDPARGRGRVEAGRD
jgi:hypothetical protein